MTIGFDVTWMDGENKSGGIFQYAVRLISALVVHTDMPVLAITGRDSQGIFDHLKAAANFREVLLETSPSLIDLVKSEKIDVIHTPIQYFPNVTMSVPMLISLHDLQHFYYPEFFPESEVRFRDFFYKRSAEFADRVIVSFQHVKDDIVKFYGIPAGKIDVCPLGTIVPQTFDSGKVHLIKIKYRLPERYIFYSANTWRHKNHLGIIRALKILHDKYNLKISLICTGQRNSDCYPQLLEEINKLDLKAFVKFTGYIPEDEVRTLLKNSTLAVIPTLYEAGSFPLMEAMAYEVPVICSNVTSLPDTIGDKRFVFNPKDVGQIAEKAAMILKDDKLMAENRANSRSKIKEGGWENAVRSFVNTYSEAINGFTKISDTPALRDKMQSYELLANKFNEQFKIQNKTIVNSLSWRLTAPLRRVATFIKRQ